MATTQSGVGLAMKYFGKLPNQGIAQFRDEWNGLTDADKAQLVEGLSNGTETY
jgi:hypothetical protein